MDGTAGDAPLAPWESAWLEWARPIVRMQSCAPEHFDWCRAALGPGEYPEDPEDTASDPTLRWPGYVGTRWRPYKGVLFVGSVHADFRKEGRRKGDPARVRVVDGMVDANRNWRNRSVDTSAGDIEYLAATRQAYATLIPGWSRDKAFGEVRLKLGDAVEEIAWTNLAHCRAQPRKTPGGEYDLQRECSGTEGAFPIGRLLDVLKPAAILVAVSPVEGTHAPRFDFAERDGNRPLCWAFNGHDEKRNGVHWRVWAAEFAEIVTERRSAAD